MPVPGGGQIPGSDEVTVRLSIPCRSLGFSPPPVSVHLRFFQMRGGWMAHAWSREGLNDPLLQWLSETVQVDELTTSRDEGLLSVQLPELPQSLERLHANLGVGLLVFEPSGAVRVALRGSRSAVRDQLAELDAVDDMESLVSHAPEEEEEEEEEEERTRGPDRLVTNQERDALIDAYEAGYFEVPRGIRLEELADKMGTSKGALSTLLRRGVERLVEAYIDQRLDEAIFLSEAEPPDEDRTKTDADDEPDTEEPSS